MLKVSLVVNLLLIGLKVVKWSSNGVEPRTFFNMILGFTNCSKDLVDDVCVVVVFVFNVVVVVVIVVGGVSKFFSFLVLKNFELRFRETCPSFPSNDPKIHPKCNHKRGPKHATHSTKSRE